jgi:thioredoxin-like negative regulator of GroEL
MDIQTRVAQAEQAIEAGNIAGARQILDQLVMEDLRNEQAWMLLAGVVTLNNERLDCLAQVLAINTNNLAARDRYIQLRPPTKPDDKKKKR